MNDRIRDLALEASVKHIASPVWAFTDAELEKFAQLIIAECISACATDRLGKTASAEELIKKHFGVPE
jgi:hypothetical protein